MNYKSVGNKRHPFLPIPIIWGHISSLYNQFNQNKNEKAFRSSGKLIYYLNNLFLYIIRNDTVIQTHHSGKGNNEVPKDCLFRMTH